jgi:hypothetical protein
MFHSAHVQLSTESGKKSESYHSVIMIIISGGSRNFERGRGVPERKGPLPEKAKNSRILGLKS